MPTINENQAESIRQKLKSEKYTNRHALLRVVAGSMRLNILTILHIHRPGLSMVDMSRILHASLSRISHQMRILRAHDAVSEHRYKGKTVYRLKFFDLVRRLTK